MTTEVLSENEIARAAEIILAGGLVAAPTETVYGLCADATNETAIRKIFTAKGRDERKPISVFVRDMRGAEALCREVPEAAYKLAEKFFPGPVTLVLRKRENVSDALTAGGDTVGVRCPDNAAVLELMRLAGVPLTGTSANLSGEKSAESAEEAKIAFDGRIEAVIDGGRCGGGVPSTVIDLTGEEIKILRAGAVSKEEIEAVIG
ncbi:MAG: threonylcarbamoyl-AMP synthase [Oscillospiraceae bacterium]|nr:threonylcarbamoyl-AMP synthase [Oscillospiraceae bacterium]